MALFKSFAIVLAICSFTVHVKSQTCETTNAYRSCSSNNACACLPIAFTDNIGICGLVGVSCWRLSACQHDDTCENSDHICIRHPQCSSSPLCYPLSMSDPRLCPPMTTTTTSTPAPFSTTQFQTTGYNFFDTTSSFYTSENLVASHYSSALTTNNHLIPGENKYYETLEIRANTSGSYEIKSTSNIDTYGCLYRGEYNPSNQITCNDDYNGNQFRLTVNLQAGVLYTLLVTTFGSLVTGSYAVTALGPAYVNFRLVESTPGTTMSFETTEASVTSEAPVVAIYSSSLTHNSPKSSNQSRYYEAIQITVNTSGQYTLKSRETLDGVGDIYQSYFNPSDPLINRMASDDQSGGNNQFSIPIYLQAGVTYILVFTTYQANITGPFSILAYGPEGLEFTGYDSFAVTTGTPFAFTSDYTENMTSNDTNSNVIVSEYSSELTQAHNHFSRADRSEGNFFYEAIEIMVNTTGFYTFVSRSTGSEYVMDTTEGYTSTNANYTNENYTSYNYMDAYGYMYENRFSPAEPRTNLLALDDDSAGAAQFRLNVFLDASRTYVLVFTTYSPNTIGSFSIVASGPDSVLLSHIYHK